MTDKIIKLEDRAILEISGLDGKKFLQGLITNDINKINSELIYSAMLSAQGRFLYDFFIFKQDDRILLDCLKIRRDEILKKFNFYKLKADVVIKKNDEIEIFSDIYNSIKNINFTFDDPRNKKMGKRIYATQKMPENLIEKDNKNYHYKRISLKIAESEYDLTYEKSIILEFGFDDLNAIDYQKGCYVGQELTARTHHLGQIRKKIFHAKIANLKNIEKNCEISCEGKNIGIILSSVFHNNELNALILLKINDDKDFATNLYAIEEKNKLFKIS